MNMNDLDFGGFTDDQILHMVQRVYGLTDAEREKLRTECLGSTPSRSNPEAHGEPMAGYSRQSLGSMLPI